MNLKVVYLQRSLARHYADKYDFSEAISVEREMIVMDISIDEKLSIYADLVNHMDLQGDYTRKHWCDVSEDLTTLLHGWNSSFPWVNVDGALPETVPTGNEVYYALYTASEMCGDYVSAWRYLMKALDMERKGRRMQNILSTNKYRFEDKIGNSVPAFNYLKNMEIKGDESVVFPIIIVGSSRTAASLVSSILGGHEAIFSLPQERSQLDYILNRRIDHNTGRGIFMSKVEAMLLKVVSIIKENSGNMANLKQKLTETVYDEMMTILRFNFGMAQAVSSEVEGLKKIHYIEYIGENANHLGMLRVLFPNAIILNIVDDPLDSLLKTIIERTDQSMQSSFFALHPSQAAKMIAIQANIIEYYRESFLRCTPPMKGITDILYSELLSDPTRVLTKTVLSPLRLEWQDEMISGKRAVFQLRREIRRGNMARNYLHNGDITIYQSTIYHYLSEVKLEEGWKKPSFPFSDKLNWDLGPQVKIADDGCAPALESRIPTRRNDIGAFLNSLGLTVGAELGVQQAIFANTTLHAWTKCKKYYLIDIWDEQDSNYLDSANVKREWQEHFYEISKATLSSYKYRTDLAFLRKFTSEAVHDIEDGSLDFVYIDARHDYCSVSEDIKLYWDKLRDGGILSGHDYMLGSNLEEFVEAEAFIDRFDVCPNGTIRHRSVKGAVDDFALSMNIQVAYTFQDKPPFLSFIMRKPCGLGLLSRARRVITDDHTATINRNVGEL